MAQVHPKAELIFGGRAKSMPARFIFRFTCVQIGWLSAVNRLPFA